MSAGNMAPTPTKRIFAALALIIILSFVYRSSFPSHDRPLRSPSHQSKYAFASLLASTVSGPDAPAAHDQSDVYFISARLLTYQLLHAPETRSTTGIPFLVLVTPDVPERQRARLIRDGATVVPIDYIREDWIVPSSPKWRDVMSKLRVLELTEYDKILLLDLDTIVCQPLDGVFDDPATEPSRAVVVNSTELKGDEGPIPSTYTMAGVRNLVDSHTFPPSAENGDFERTDYFNAGFFVVKPSIEQLNFYLSVLKLTDRFEPGLPEQSMLNYVHRWTGPMPWKPLDPRWNINNPKLNDYERGARSLQEKWWAPPRKELEKLFLSWRWRMEGFFESKDRR